MSPPRIRRTVAGFILAMLVATAAPAGAADFRLPVLGLQDFWSRAWGWLMDLRPDAAPAGAAKPQEHGRKSLTPAPPPNPPPNTGSINGDKGSGLDPDG
jgi:hypothetical protein